MKKKPDTTTDAAALRRRAEAKLRKQRRAQRSGAADPKSEADRRRLLHELEVHQVELEMQNEELSRTKAQAEQSAGKFSDLYEFAPIGFVSMDDRSRIRELNLTAANLLGKPRTRLAGTPFVQSVARKDRGAFLRHLRTSSETEAKVTAEVDLASEDGRTRSVQLSTICLQQKSGRAREYRTAITDIKERKEAERYKDLLVDILEHLNAGGEMRPMCRDILGKIRTFVAVEAAAIRLREGENFPYFEQIGFPADFIRAENSLLSSVPARQLARDDEARPILECMCGTIVNQRTDPTKPFFSERGSFWTNSTTELLAATTEADRQGHTRNRCHAEGYESVALVPLRSGGEIIGLLQLNDRRPDRFTPKLVRFLEGVGNSIGVSLKHKQAEDGLQEAHGRTIAVLESITDGFFNLDRDYRLTYVNREAERILGKTRRELLGRNLWQEFPEAFGTVFHREYERAMTTNKTVHFEEFYPPFKQWFEVHAYPSETGLSVYFSDITARKQAEAEIRQLNADLEERVLQRTATIRKLASELTLAEQREKSRLSEIIHDHVQQLLLAAKLFLQDIKQNTAEPGRVNLQKVEEMLSEAMDALRTLSVELNPPILRGKGLSTALHWLGNWMREKHGLNVSVKVRPNQAPLSEEMSVLLYQAVRELLLNVVKHAGVRRVRVEMDWNDSEVRAVVSDRGKGFDPILLETSAARSSQLGLFWVRERLALLDGRVDIKSAPGRGSRFTLRVPLPMPAARQKREETVVVQ